MGISNADSKPKLNGPRAITAKPRKKNVSVVQSTIEMLSNLDKRLTDPFPHIPSASSHNPNVNTNPNANTNPYTSAPSQLKSSIPSASTYDPNRNRNRSPKRSPIYRSPNRS